MKVKGLDSLTKDIKKLEKNAKSLNGYNSIPFNDLFSYEFMSENTNFDSIEEFFRGAGIEVNIQEEFQELDERVLNDAVVRFTQYSSWDEMAHEAGALYIKRKLFEGVKL
ncbi:MAG: hypothetical protein ACTH29_06175 [Fusobacterium sp.]